MGYYTLHKIRIINEYNTKKNLIILLKKIDEISGYGFEIVGSTIFDSNSNGGSGSKWYHCRGDMIKVSEELPELEIQVIGKDEEGEIWEYIYKNGFEHRGDSRYFSDVDEESNFEEENENNQLSDYEEEEENEENEENELEENNLDELGIEEQFQDIKIEDNIKYAR